MTAILFVLCASCGNGGQILTLDMPTMEVCQNSLAAMIPPIPKLDTTGLTAAQAQAAKAATDDAFEEAKALRGKLVVKCLPRE